MRIIILLLLFASCCNAQSWTPSKMMVDSNGLYHYTSTDTMKFGLAGDAIFSTLSITEDQQTESIDTTRVMLFMIDTSFYDGSTVSIQNGSDSDRIDIENRMPYLFWSYGYEVTKRIFIKAHDEVIDGGNSILFVDDHWESRLVKYLNEQKKPLSKIFMVWQTL